LNVCAHKGLYLISVGIWELGEHTSIRLAPLSQSTLVTTGVYGILRHPMYSGLLSLCFGISITGDSVEKVILAIILTFVTDKVVENEETLLGEKYGRSYAEYASKTKRFVPQIY